jgi:hypothetical protein
MEGEMIALIRTTKTEKSQGMCRRWNRNMKEAKGKLLIVINGKKWRVKATMKDYQRIVNSVSYDHMYSIDYLVVAGGKTDSVVWLKVPKERS